MGSNFKVSKMLGPSLCNFPLLHLCCLKPERMLKVVGNAEARFPPFSRSSFLCIPAEIVVTAFP